MPGVCVIGLQWGDEAKGKVVDLLTQQHQVVVRYQGGANAGHTVVADGQTYKLSLIPSGILHPGVTCVIATGVVIDPAVLLAEIEQLQQRGVEVAGRLLVSDRAHVIFPWHIEEDRIFGQRALDEGEAIGTTLRGIGPCYRDKVGRYFAIRVGDLLRSDAEERIRRVAEEKNRALRARAGDQFQELDGRRIAQQYRQYAEQLAPYVADTTEFLLSALEQQQHVLFEGAQGALLDVDHGTFPYVTSSNSSGLGVSSGSGVPGRYIQRVIGVVKAYTTRVGGGPFPTEQDNAIGEHLRRRGNEYGTVTRRPRRCGWFDAVAARYTARISGVDHLAVTLLDVLSGLPELKVCTAYRIGQRQVSSFPSHAQDLEQAEPVYETLPGWQEDISQVRQIEDLPQAARDYLDCLSRLVGRPVKLVSVGPDRCQTMFVPAASGDQLLVGGDV